MAEERKESFIIKTKGVPQDGYTLVGKIKVTGRPQFSITYRPALPETVYAYRLAARNAENGNEHWLAVLNILVATVVDWDIQTQGENGATVPLKFERAALENPVIRAALGVEGLDEMVNFVTGYKGWEEDRKNS